MLVERAFNIKLGIIEFESRTVSNISNLSSKINASIFYELSITNHRDILFANKEKPVMGRGISAIDICFR